MRDSRTLDLESRLEHDAQEVRYAIFEPRTSNLAPRSGGGQTMRISDLRLLDVVNVKDGRRLGPIKDLDLDLEKGVVKGIIVPGPSRSWGLFGSGKSEDYIVPWDRVKKIGVDVILVDANDLPEFNTEHGDRR